VKSARARIYLVLIACALIVVSVIVLIMDMNLSTELLGSAAFLGGLAVLINLLLDMFGNGNGKG
jgi:hypothetical protein